jgi:hypothetical protein
MADNERQREGAWVVVVTMPSWRYQRAVTAIHASPGRQWLWVSEIGWYPFHPVSRPMGGDGLREVPRSMVVIDDTVANGTRVPDQAL